MTKKPKNIYYLAQAYSFFPLRAYREACNWTKELRKAGFLVFSPILHTHGYDSYHTYERYGIGSSENYVKWDIEILEQFKNPIVVFAQTSWRYYNNETIDYRNSELFKLENMSEGTRAEYVWAKKNNIKCIHLLPLLMSGEEIEVECV